jgi:hypothetical protein
MLYDASFRCPTCTKVYWAAFLSFESISPLHTPTSTTQHTQKLALTNARMSDHSSPASSVDSHAHSDVQVPHDTSIHTPTSQPHQHQEYHQYQHDAPHHNRDHHPKPHPNPPNPISTAIRDHAATEHPQSTMPLRSLRPLHPLHRHPHIRRPRVSAPGQRP